MNKVSAGRNKKEITLLKEAIQHSQRALALLTKEFYKQPTSKNRETRRKLRKLGYQLSGLFSQAEDIQRLQHKKINIQEFMA